MRGVAREWDTRSNNCPGQDRPGLRRTAHVSQRLSLSSGDCPHQFIGAEVGTALRQNERQSVQLLVALRCSGHDWVLVALRGRFPRGRSLCLLLRHRRYLLRSCLHRPHDGCGGLFDRNAACLAKGRTPRRRPPRARPRGTAGSEPAPRPRGTPASSGSRRPRCSDLATLRKPHPADPCFTSWKGRSTQR